MTREDDVEDEIRRRLEADPTIQRLLVEVYGRHPSYRYFETSDGRGFLWTTERGGDGKFWSAVMAPYGPGARSGNPSRWKTTREVHHRTRRAAKARALRLYQQHRAHLEA